MRSLPLALLPALAVGVLALPACGGKTVTRTDSQAAKDLSGRWNDVDAKQVANELIPKAVNAGWIERFRQQHNREPRLQLGRVIVRADGEVISTDVFMKEIRGAFINSGKVVVLDEDKSQTREELADQASFAAQAKEMAQEEAADFLLKGSIVTQNDQEGRQSVKYYLVTLEITDIQARRIVWQGNTRIRKEVEQSRWK